MAERLLVVCRHFWPERTRLNDLCEELIAAGYHVDVLCGQPSRPDGRFYHRYDSIRVQRETWNKINIYRTFDVKRGSGSNLSIFLNYITFPLAGLWKSRVLEKNSYDAVLIFQRSPVMMCEPGLRISRRKHIPAYIYVAQLWPQGLYSVIDVQSGLFRRLLQRISMNSYTKAQKLIVPSDRLRRYFRDRMGRADTDLPIVPLPAERYFETQHPDDDLLERLAGSFCFLMTGDWESRLSPDTFVKTAQLIRKQGMTNIRFLICGAGERVKTLSRRIAAEGLEDYFYLEGQVDPESIGTYLHAADALLAVVKPNALDEFQIPPELSNGLAAGKPVLITLSGMVREMVKGADCGLTSEPGDAGELASNILKLCQMSPQKRNQMGMRAAALKEELFDRHEYAGRILRILAGDEEALTDETEPVIQKLW